jgi:hypothetical protein
MEDNINEMQIHRWERLLKLYTRLLLPLTLLFFLFYKFHFRFPFVEKIQVFPYFCLPFEFKTPHPNNACETLLLETLDKSIKPQNTFALNKT